MEDWARPYNALSPAYQNGCRESAGETSMIIEKTNEFQRNAEIKNISNVPKYIYLFNRIWRAAKSIDDKNLTPQQAPPS